MWELPGQSAGLREGAGPPHAGGGGQQKVPGRSQVSEVLRPPVSGERGGGSPGAGGGRQTAARGPDHSEGPGEPPQLHQFLTVNVLTVFLQY